VSFKRGSVVTTDIGYGRHHYLVVSGDARNAQLRSFLGVRLTTKPNPRLDSIVELAADDAPLVGRVLCDNIIELNHAECRAKGQLSVGTLRRVDDGLLAALGIDDLYTRVRGT
jgi:mRNA-degrading endonuclease toxin of MazEF toxin-antitoxin module